MTFAIRAIAGVALACGVAYAGVRAGSLTRSGGGAAAIVGTVAVAVGWNWAAVLIAYFAVSTVLSKIGAERKRRRLAGIVDKTGARDATQVMANGFVFLFCAAGSLAAPPAQQMLWMACAAGSLAASAADTWATEIGTLVGRPPRSILTGRRMAVGESGGVTLAGWVAAIAGAAFVGGTAVIAGLPTAGFLPVLAGGIAGAAIDSIAGAAIQRRSWCDACQQSTEMRIHVCGTPTRHTGGVAWLENDGVNLIAAVTGALAAWAMTAVTSSGSQLGR